jgi:hypothetical protein
LLRARRFVDLFSVVRNGIRVSTESYSIKRLEPLNGYSRLVTLPDANKALSKVQACLELGDLDFISESDREAVAGYNKDDCLSTLALRDWLESRREYLISLGTDVPRPETPTGTPSESLSAWQEKINVLITKLTEGVPPDVMERTPEEHARWLLAYSRSTGTGASKRQYGGSFRLRDLGADDLLDERAALSGLSFVAVNGGTARAPIHRYNFPAQESEFRGGENLHNVGGDKLGAVEGISIEERWIDIKKRGDSVDVHPDAVFAHKVVGNEVLAEALVRIGEYVAEHGIEGDGPSQAGRDLLMRRSPRLGGQPIQLESETTLNSALRIAPSLIGGISRFRGRRAPERPIPAQQWSARLSRPVKPLASRRTVTRLSAIFWTAC